MMNMHVGELSQSLWTIWPKAASFGSSTALLLRTFRAHTWVLSMGPASGRLCGAAPCRATCPGSTSGWAPSEGCKPPLCVPCSWWEGCSGGPQSSYIIFQSSTVFIGESEKSLGSLPAPPSVTFRVFSRTEVQFSSVQFSCSVGPNLCDPMDCSTPGLPVHHQLPEFTQTHVHWVGDAIQPSHPLSSPSPPAFNLSQHQGLFQWVSSLHQVARVLEFQLQHQSFQWIVRTALL